MEKHYQDLKHIRRMMERSSRFISLSGWAGIFAGLYALIGAFVGWLVLYSPTSSFFPYSVDFAGVEIQSTRYTERQEIIIFITLVCLTVLLFSLVTAAFFTIRKSKKNKLPIWTSTTKKMLINLSIPLFTGGIFSFALIYYGYRYSPVLFNPILLVPATTLIFYGLALLNASHYTFQEIRYLGTAEILLGLTALFFLGYGIYFWAIGFGVLHIIYGVIMYKKYD